MKLYNRYIFYKILAAFFAIVALLVALIWFSRTISFVSYITENGVELYQVFILFLLILPWLLMFIIPISLFVAILIIYNRLIINNEIAILKNSGLTKFSIGKPVKSVAISATLFCFLISLFLMPYANKKLRLAKLNFENNYSNISFEKGTFESIKNLTIYIKDKDLKNELYGILIHDERDKGFSLTITAKQGHVLFEDDKLLLYMQGGTIQRFNTGTFKSEILNFDDYVFNLSGNAGARDQEMRWKPKERYVSELIDYNKDFDEKEIARYRAELQQRITYPLMPIVLSSIALAAMLGGSFSRYGNTRKILLAAIAGLVFLSLTITCYRLIESHFYYIFLLYFNFALFLLAPILHLKISK